MHSGISGESIRVLVEKFYGAVRLDDKLGAVFSAAIGTSDEEWAPHLERITLFWAGIMLGAKGYDGKPLQVHKELPPFDPKFFSRWLALFANTAIETHDIGPATAFIRKAVRIADMMTRDLFGREIEMPPMPAMPDNMQRHRTTPLFMAENIPDALRKTHRTAPGVYGRIVITKGRMLYTIGRKECHVLTSETPGVIEPEKLHFVTPLDDTEFVVEFYKDRLSLSSGLSSS